MTRAALIEVLAAFPSRVAQAVAVAGPPPPGQWGPTEVVRHLIAVEDDVWSARLAQLAVEDEPRWAWTEPGLAPGFDDAPPGSILGAFAAARARTIVTLRDLDDAGWARTGAHATHGRLDVEGLIRVAIDHDADHLASLRAR